MNHFSSKAFEHLLFPLHRSVYMEIDRKLNELEQRFPGAIAQECMIYEQNFANASTEGATLPADTIFEHRPGMDVYVSVDEFSIKRAHKCSQARVLMQSMAQIGQPQRSDCSNHLVLTLQSDGVQQNFIVPLPLVLQAFESRVCKPGSYQVYEHNLIRKKATMVPTMDAYMAGAAQYVGITGRSWQQRSQEHHYAARRGSLLRFHRALRNEFFDIFAHEHIVLRAGLNRAQALRIEEIEVEERTLHDLHPNGLNMIPGGEAGLRYLASMIKRPRSAIDLEKVDALLEQAIVDSLRQPGLNVKKQHTNEKLAALWRDDIAFRIRAMTSQNNRLSYLQIRSARIWHAAGWALKKIFEKIKGMEDRVIQEDQISRLLDGKTYQTIPHVLGFD